MAHFLSRAWPIALVALAGCRTQSGEPESFATSALTAATATITVAVPRNIDVGGCVLAAGNSVTLGDRSVVADPICNVGAGGATIGVDARTAAILTRSALITRDRAFVNGKVETTVKRRGQNLASSIRLRDEREVRHDHAAEARRVDMSSRRYRDRLRQGAAGVEGRQWHDRCRRRRGRRPARHRDRDHPPRRGYVAGRRPPLPRADVADRGRRTRRGHEPRDRTHPHGLRRASAVRHPGTRAERPRRDRRARRPRGFRHAGADPHRSAGGREGGRRRDAAPGSRPAR